MSKRTGYLSSATGMLLTILWAAGLAGQSIDTTQPNRFKELLDVSGFTEQLTALPAAVEQSVDLSTLLDTFNGALGAEDIIAVKDALVDAFSADALQTSVELALSESMSVVDVNTMTAFFNSPLGLRVKTAEISQSILTERNQFEAWYTEGGSAAQPVNRQQQIKELGIAMHATQAAVDSMIGMQVAIQISITPALPAEQRQPVYELIKAAQSQRAVLTNKFRESSRQTLAYVFRDQSLEDIKAYTRLLQTAAGQRYIQASNVGLSRGMFAAAERLGKSLQPLLANVTGLGV